MADGLRKELRSIVDLRQLCLNNLHFVLRQIQNFLDEVTAKRSLASSHNIKKNCFSCCRENIAVFFVVDSDLLGSLGRN